MRSNLRVMRNPPEIFNDRVNHLFARFCDDQPCFEGKQEFFRGIVTMTISRTIAKLACALALVAPVVAAAAPLVALDSDVFVERFVPSKGRLLQPASALKRGDRVVYIVSWTRMGGAGGFTVTIPLPREVYFQGSADGREEVSVDGGRTWGKLESLRVGGRLATAEDVTHVRWKVQAQEAARGTGQITYSAIVR